MDVYTYTASLPQKRLAAGALLLNQQGEILIVKPVYRDGWLIPGGAIEADESPRAGCHREVQEELGLTLPLGRLLSLDYQIPQPDRTECLHFIFAGPAMTAALIAQIQLPGNELSAYQFAPLATACGLLSVRLGRRFSMPTTHMKPRRSYTPKMVSARHKDERRALCSAAFASL